MIRVVIKKKKIYLKTAQIKLSLKSIQCMIEMSKNQLKE